MSGRTAAVQTAVEAFWQAWSNRDLQSLHAVWDGDDPDCSYLPAEWEHRLVGGPDVSEFMQHHHAV